MCDRVFNANLTQTILGCGGVAVEENKYIVDSAGIGVCVGKVNNQCNAMKVFSISGILANAVAVGACCVAAWQRKPSTRAANTNKYCCWHDTRRCFHDTTACRVALWGGNLAGLSYFVQFALSLMLYDGNVQNPDKDHAQMYGLVIVWPWLLPALPKYFFAPSRLS